YLYAMMNMEPAISDALSSHLETATDINEIRFLVAVYIAAFRMAITVWLEQEATGNLTAIVREHLGRLAFQEN
ncbi:MAG TPA: hypothetical protein VKB76_02605, partial [Ktedonobacterales bacterium]|nr:hypothetical protein [Ktedonobacterales bacterium]